ncbi:pyruvate dehydrogenase (acetyl-transferring) E1 component subunit alpha [Aeromicrobium wangtongii]|uniref:Pyruvate dehydrogenase (Acetyl-transferring) E1 component subunit alpha n=1 Tax=Aeromicrobium wangtongii TaxID=2969247 RepID=A0ABY5M991_9ACTN|nr:pyruvate dehydrogenase (acetyl-transferring) E1 component subunit alpha [Aeromicrobium wangtongii]MCD9199976.1 pyruvate dehydrogenase (acetyl-transferring) E1 component subunit alpha [Aeromicrobium wangtongii]UUP13593.1 pyruvate dehydrogenase (acetyl-transferring) E1 component subunit alpha [Aeromicrobium wangtongii]
MNPLTSHPGTPEVPLVQLLTPTGQRVENPDHDFAGDRAEIESLYRDLVMTRRVDTEAFALQRHGELGLWPPALGQEAAQVGSARALRPHDFAFPSYREHGVAWCRGVDPAQLLGVYRGSEMGGWDPADHQLALPNIIIGSQALHATGYAMGLTLEGLVGTGDPDRDSAVIAYFGDGATSEGDVSEALDWAAVQQAPVVFFCQNNQYAISVPVASQSRVPIVQRAAGFGMPGVRVDGNDVLACRAVTERALQRARDGQGPTLIEAVTYRMGPHTTSDDPTRYRGAAEVDEWRAKDPIERVRLLLEAEGTPPEFFTDLQAEADALGVHLREACQRIAEPDLAVLFDHVFAERTVENDQQKAEFVAWRDAIEGSVA